ncbi:MAG: bifunctional aspartate kinase/homoserine dehydrogenase I [Flavobacteriales bacterium]|nr:bifunctional aspartate kinase/homoserine dehydrogenase I [Flavobacteriales bacterium]
MKILKFGGTSVGTAESISNVVEIIVRAKAEGPIVAVCSAMGGITNKLLAVGEKARNGEEFLEDLREIEQRHHAVIRALLKPGLQNKALIAVKVRMNALEEILYGVQALSELSWATLDKITAFGELLSNEMVAEIVTHSGHRAIFTDARDLLRTDSNFGSATVDKEASEALITSWYKGESDAVPIVTGFIAANSLGQTTTLGRGGSDYTAALLGSALDAEEVQIWTDVDGFMTADPRRVKKAYPLQNLTYEEAMELCYFGAKVIYPPTMLPAVAKRIPITVKNTFNPESPGTTVMHIPDSGKGLIKGIASIDDVCLINVQGSGMIGSKGVSSRLFSAMAGAGVNIMLITQASSEHSISLCVAPEQVETARAAIEEAFELERMRGRIEPPEVVTGLSILAVVGENMRHTIGISGKLFRTLGRNGVNVAAIAQGSSERNISVVVEKKALSKALNAVHDSLFLSSIKTVNAYLVGTGNIGAELIAQLRDSSEALAERHYLQIKVMGITNSRKMIFGEGDGIDLSDWKNTLDTKGENADIDRFIATANEHNLQNAVFVDNTSNTGIVAKYPEVFKAGLSIATCNKIGNSSSLQQYRDFRNAALKNGAVYHYETTVGAALPIIQTLNDLVMSGDKIVRIQAILSGTISFIFNKYQGDITFSEVVREAQEMGYTEPDPRDDLNGMDFARKMLILSREMGLETEPDNIEILPILPEACLKAPDLDSFYKELEKAEPYFAEMKNTAAAEGKKLRYIGKLEGEVIKIAPESVDASHPFYGLEGSDNIIAFSTERYNQGPLVVKGPGAGPQVTAAGVYADIIKVASA